MDLLIHHLSHDRVCRRLAEYPVRPLVVGADGVIRDPRGAAIAPEDARFRIAWTNTDVFVRGPSRPFLVAVLKSPTVRWVQSSAAGVDGSFFARLADKGVVLTNSNANAIAIAEYVIAGVLDWLHPFRERREAQAARRWQRLGFREIHGSTWLVVGLGNIGSEVAKRARAFGAHVIGVRRTPEGDEPADEVVPPDRLAAVLPRADVVVLTAPATAATRHMADAAFFGRMKTGAGFVNVARGSLVDEPALLAALDRGSPGWALLDVFEAEPLPAESPFWHHPRVRLTAHVAGVSPGTDARNDVIFLDNLGRFLAGDPLRFVVDPAVVKGEGA